ncbi:MULTISPECIES: hemerythrin domain-containing protein [unclassified Amycolatopsis]|uniref:hemerythrin domain-containing protein n=1 Tax=unclassified Amycolatopsis TaxID=2618356 RepID=UPI002875E248|nr:MULTISPECIES: hemerythrin domain-containing protein [unclassified Amycolatopsis]MDS0135828.1 hemerythrin domain-containing protein [Amycolatopsis sp. 505]MDS0145571.1 hemerythrin domain-containing protein [Amycolatopsis sp. CM201R]
MTGGELTAVPTPVPGVRLSRRQLWDERTRPQAPPPEAGRRYTPREQAGGTRLIEVHDYLRTELTRLRTLMAGVSTGAIGPAAARAGLHALALRPGGTPYAGHCRAFCRIVLLHHNREDTDVFPRLRAFDPRLGPVVDRLEEEHEALHGLVERIDRTLVAEPLDGSALRAAVDLLTDALLSHLSYEEHELVEPLARLWG